MKRKSDVWYIYLLEINVANDKRLYCSYTDDLKSGLWNLLSCKYDNYINRFYKTNPKRVVYVEYVIGTEYDAMGRELEIKKMNVKSKRKLIGSHNNKLIVYRPNNVIILQDKDDYTKQQAILLYSGSIF